MGFLLLWDLKGEAWSHILAHTSTICGNPFRIQTLSLVQKGRLGETWMDKERGLTCSQVVIHIYKETWLFSFVIFWGKALGKWLWKVISKNLGAQWGDGSRVLLLRKGTFGKLSLMSCKGRDSSFHSSAQFTRNEVVQWNNKFVGWVCCCFGGLFLLMLVMVVFCFNFCLFFLYSFYFDLTFLAWAGQTLILMYVYPDKGHI